MLLRLTPLLLHLLIDTISCRDSKQFGLFGFTNPFGIYGHSPCVSNFAIEKEKRVGECKNENECVLEGGTPGGYCKSNQGMCCVHTNEGECHQTLSQKFGYFFNKGYPNKLSGNHHCTFTVKPKTDTCFVRFDLLTLEMEEESGNCVHDRLTILGGKEPSGQLCGDRSGEVTIIEVDRGSDIVAVVSSQSKGVRYQLGVTQISCKEVKEYREKHEKESWTETEDGPACGQKNPSFNKIGMTGAPDKDEKTANKRRIKKTAQEVFKELKDLTRKDEFEIAALRRDIYRPSRLKKTKTQLKQDRYRHRSQLNNQERFRVLYGNETSTNEYPWQISMWIDRSHFCGGTLINSEWAVTAAHCVDLQYRDHFRRITVSLQDHNVDVFNESKNMFRKLKRIVRFPTYDENFLHGDLALLQFDSPVPLSQLVLPACLPKGDDTWAFRNAIITGWGYTEVTKKSKPRPTTSSVLREAEQYILPQELCHKFSPFPITPRMICTFKGPLGTETTCQGDSGGPLVVNNGTNQFVLVGATSFGVSTCEGPYPAMFSRVSTFLDFIYAALVPAPMEYLIHYSPPKVV